MLSSSPLKVQPDTVSSFFSISTVLCCVSFFGHLSPTLCTPLADPLPSLPPLLYSINLSIRPVDYIRDYRLKGIPFHLSLALLALLLSLSLYRSSALTHPSPSVSLTHVYLYTQMLPHLMLFPFPSSPDLTYHLSPPPPPPPPPPSLSACVGHVLSCHSSFSSVCLPPPPSLSPSISSSLPCIILLYLLLSHSPCTLSISFASPQHDHH